MRERMISSAKVIDALVNNIGVCDQAVREALSVAGKSYDEGDASAMAEACAKAIGFAFARSAHELTLRKVKCQPYELVERGY